MAICLYYIMKLIGTLAGRRLGWYHVLVLHLGHMKRGLSGENSCIIEVRTHTCTFFWFPCVPCKYT